MADGVKRFLVFWDSGNDAELVARHYKTEAENHARAIHKQIVSKLVDTNSSDPDKQFWDAPSTIECVTVDGTAKKDTAQDPQDTQIDQMVDNL